MFALRVLTIVAIAAMASGQLADDDNSCTCSQDMCTNVPSDGMYFLTSFCDSSGEEPPGVSNRDHPSGVARSLAFTFQTAVSSRLACC